MITTLKTLITLLTPARVTLQDLRPKLGTVVKTYPNNTHIKPLDAHFSHIDVVQQYKSDQVANVDLTLTTALPLKTLQAEFGEYKLVVPDDSGPNQAIFYIKQPSQPSDIALIATLDRKGVEVTTITLRRDVHQTG